MKYIIIPIALFIYYSVWLIMLVIGNILASIILTLVHFEIINTFKAIKWHYKHRNFHGNYTDFGWWKENIKRDKYVQSQ